MDRCRWGRVRRSRRRSGTNRDLVVVQESGLTTSSCRDALPGGGRRPHDGAGLAAGDPGRCLELRTTLGQRGATNAECRAVFGNTEQGCAGSAQRPSEHGSTRSGGLRRQRHPRLVCRRSCHSGWISGARVFTIVSIRVGGIRSRQRQRSRARGYRPRIRGAVLGRERRRLARLDPRDRVG